MLFKTIDRISAGFNHISVWCIFALMIVGIVGIVARFAGAPLSGIISLSVFILVGLVYIAQANAQLQKSHVAVQLLLMRVSFKPRLYLKTVAALFSVFACALLVVASWPYAWESLQMGERMHGEPFYPVYPSKICVALGLSIFLIQLTVDFLRELRALIEQTGGHQTAKEVRNG